MIRHRNLGIRLAANRPFSIDYWAATVRKNNRQISKCWLFCIFFGLCLSMVVFIALTTYLGTFNSQNYKAVQSDELIVDKENSYKEQQLQDNTQNGGNFPSSKSKRPHFALDAAHIRVLSRHRRISGPDIRPPDIPLPDIPPTNMSVDPNVTTSMPDANVTMSVATTSTNSMIDVNVTTPMTEVNATTPMIDVNETTPMINVTTAEMTTADFTTGSSTTPPIQVTSVIPVTRTTTTEGGLLQGNVSLIVVIGVLALLLCGFILWLLILCFCPCACCLPCLACFKRRRDRYVVETVDAATLSIPMETFHETDGRYEDMLKDALEVGSVAVLEFSIKEARSGVARVDPELLAEAEKKLNEWKRTLSLLGSAYKSKDIFAMEEYMTRFVELEIKDESRIYKRSVELQDNIAGGKATLNLASLERNEEKLVAAISSFNALGLPHDYASKATELSKAMVILEQIKQERLLKGKTQQELKETLKSAVDNRNASLIKSTIVEIESAQIISMGKELEEGRTVLSEIQNERLAKRDAAWQQLLDASQSRDAGALRDALRSCAEFGVENEQIREGEKLLKIVEREDQLLHEMRELIELKDSSKLLEAIAIFRTPGLQLVDKTGDVERADEMLQQLREKERLQRAKGDAMWRLQNARNIGDVVVMEGMIKALENLASMGEEIDEADLLRAKAELEMIRGRVDYRKRMEAIKSAISRMAIAENLPQLADLIEQMVELSADVSFTMTADDSRVLDESRVILHDLRRKHAIMDEMEATRPALTLPQIPDSLQKLKAGVETMSRLKESAMEFDGVFLPEDDQMLTVATMNANELEEKVKELKAAEERLEAAVEAREYEELLEAIKQAEAAPFFDQSAIENAKDLALFLNPATRVDDLTAAIKSRNIEQLRLAIADFKEANVPNQAALLERAERRLKKLIKQEKKKRKAEKRRKKEAARRDAEINKLNESLREAMDEREIPTLETALEACESSGYDCNEIPIFGQAEELLEELTIAHLRRNLLDAIERRDIFELEKTIDQADYGGYVNDLGEDYLCAKDLLFHLRELHRLREAISGMNRSLISEIHRYPTPPQPVHTVMTAALIMLGEDRKNVTNWADVQILIGKLGNDSITRRVRRRAPGDITPKIRNQVEKIIDNLDIETVQDISKGAAAFFAWMKCMTKESYYVKSPGGDEPST